MISQKKLVYGLALIMLCLLSWAVTAQETTTEACPALVQRALVEMEGNCDSLDRNSACYGFNQVETAFTEAVAEDFFTSPSDIANLNPLQTIRTSPLDIEMERWGVAVMNAQANVPGILPGQAVTFILMGDAQVTNAVAPEEVVEFDPFTVTTTVRANVRSGAGTNNNVLGVVDVGTDLTADALNPDRTWIRIVYGGRLAWTSIDVVDTLANLAELPTTESDTLSPMQAFYFQTGLGNATCAEAPDVVGIHSPEGLTVDLSVNGAEISVGSFITLRNTAPDAFALTVIEGHVENEGGDIIETGETIPGKMDDSGTIIDWGDKRPATEDELYLGELFDEEEVLIDLGIEEEATNIGTFSCGGFASTSPTLGLGYGFNQFFWNPASGNITNYRVVVVNQETGGSVSADTQGTETSLGLNLTQETIGGGFNFAWYVQALRNGTVVCTSATIALQRGSEVIAPPAGGGAIPFNAYIVACNAYDMTIGWDSVSGGETVTITLLDYGVPDSAGPFPGPTGAYPYSTGSALNVTNLVVTSSGGYTVNLPNCP